MFNETEIITDLFDPRVFVRWPIPDHSLFSRKELEIVFRKWESVQDILDSSKELSDLKKGE